MSNKKDSTMEKKEKPKFATAYIRNLRISPIKLRRLTKELTGLSVEKAVMHLTFSKISIAKEVKELIRSAMANAENNYGMDIDNLTIHSIDVGKSIIMKRFIPCSKGRAGKIKKPFSNIKIILVEKTKELKSGT